MGIVGNTSMGPGSPEPVAYNYRRPSLGKPSLAYQAASNRVQTTVAQGKGDSRLSAFFQPRPPVRAPGTGGATGTFIDANA